MRTTHRVLLALMLALACSSLTFGYGSAAETRRPPEEIANDALDVVSSRFPTPHDHYMVVICRADQAAKLSADTALGAFVRYMSTVKSDLAVVVAPDGFSEDPTYVVYFAGTSPLGLATLEASDERPTDATMAKAYGAITGPIAKRKRQAAYASASVPLDEGAIDVLRIVGWK